MRYCSACILICFFTLLSGAVQGAYAGDAAQEEKVTVCFRCDDFFAAGDPPAQRILKTKKDIIAVFRENKVPLTIGVIPSVHSSLSGYPTPFTTLTPGDPLAAVLREIKNDHNFEIALHGLSHVPNPVSKISEWIGLPLETQRARIAEGKRILEDAVGIRDVTTFIPPWNSFDLNTLSALQMNRFTFLSGDVGIVRNRPFTLRSANEILYQGITLIPATSSLGELKDALALAKKDPDSPTLVVVFHPYDFKSYRRAKSREGALDIAGLDTLLKELKQDSRLTFSRIRDLDQKEFSASRYTAASRYALLLKLAKVTLPKDLLERMYLIDRGTGHWIDKGRYLHQSTYTFLFIKAMVLLSALLLIASIVAAFLVHSALKKRHAALMRLLYTFTAFLFLMGFIYLEISAEFLSSPNMRGLLILYCLGFIGFIAAFLSFEHRRTQRQEFAQ